MTAAISPSPIHSSSDTARALDTDQNASTGQTAARWIQPSITRMTTAPVLIGGSFETVGHYASAASPSLSLVREEIAEWQLAAASAFFAFEARLPGNEE